jgi:hypothetical protein
MEEEKKVEIRLREIVIKTDGKQIIVDKCEATQLELKEICREILQNIGG